MQIDDAIENFLSGYFSTHQRSSKTVRAYSLDLRQFAGFLVAPGLELEGLSADVCEEWASRLKAEGYAPASIRRKFASLRVFLSYWVRRGVLHRSPLWQIRLDVGRRPSLPRTLTAGEVERLVARAWLELEEAEDLSAETPGPRFFALRDLALVELLFATGIRVGELVALRLRDFRQADRELTIQGKGSRQRLALISDERALQVLVDYCGERRRLGTEHDALFVNTRSGPLSTQSVAAVLRRLGRGAGLSRHLTPHMMRHTVATLLLRNGADIRVVQEFLGHASITTTERYTHVTKTHLANVLRQHHPSYSLPRYSLPRHSPRSL
jgi:integrase/recombinase XerD